jgi:beta-glucosidase
VARILFGEVNPSGRLPITFVQSEDQLPRPLLPDKSTAYGFFDVAYTEGADLGYRWFESRRLQPLFPFGFGLSYTTFALDGFQVAGGDTITAEVTITNSGTREGSETVQLYVTPPASGAAAAARLAGWRKISLKPGETGTVTITAEPRSLAHFDSEANLWRVPAGDYAVSVRASATEIKASAFVTLSERTVKP